MPKPEQTLTVRSALVFACYLAIRDQTHSCEELMTLVRAYFDLLQDAEGREQMLEMLARGPQ